MGVAICQAPVAADRRFHPVGAKPTRNLANWGLLALAPWIRNSLIGIGLLT